MVEKKKFFEVKIPLLRKQIHLLGTSKSDLNNKFIKIDLTRSLRGKSLELKFKVKADNENAFAYPVESNILSYYIRRMMRKGINYVEESFKAECENATIRIKPFLITRKKVSRAVRNELRKRTIEFVTDYVKNKTIEEIFTAITSNSLQKNISLKLKKTYPLALFEIRVLKVIKRKQEPEPETPKKSEEKSEKTKEQKNEKTKEAKTKEKQEEEKKKTEKKTKTKKSDSKTKTKKETKKKTTKKKATKK